MMTNDLIILFILFNMLIIGLGWQYIEYNYKKQLNKSTQKVNQRYDKVKTDETIIKEIIEDAEWMVRPFHSVDNYSELSLLASEIWQNKNKRYSQKRVNKLLCIVELRLKSLLS